MTKVYRVAVIGGSPEPASVRTIRDAVHGADAVVAIDRGLDAAIAASVHVDLFCGDADSVSATGAEFVRRAEAGETGTAFEVERYNPHKDFTDLSLVLRAVHERWGTPTLACTCLSGGNPDHLLGVFGRLAAWEGGIELMEDAFSGRILHSEDAWTITSASGARFSFIPLSPEVVVSESNMRWELDHAHVELLSDLGISNVIVSSSATITCHEGTLVCWTFK